ncbi:uncharacterized protein LOC105421450 [Amborella trichopoda]|uniref:uncharacterized protein LOC105421450 n=1 Tax=Amborella trichopoda TaxID=13333 RepID=UPI0005D40673|nr:uncharacterized protein LOC105421450 [Amborella trichopoda]|eukprot:XP_011627190.1 uncharacterized protein LOC105421450 [Amborella trichopoda]
MIRGFLRRAQLFKGVNSTLIALIPKKYVIATLGDIRPISLFTKLYKIVAKVLAERLKEILFVVISGPQLPSIKDNLISNSGLVAQECIHSKILERTLGVEILFQLPNEGPGVSYLQYADETMLFCGAQRPQVSNIAIFLKCCEVAFGLKVNFEKTNMVGLNCLDEEVSFLAQVFGCKVDNFPIIYLGMSLSDGRLSIAVWDKIIQHIQVKLDLWKFKYLSFGGKIMLIKACLSNLPIYQMSIVQILTLVAKKIETMMRNFL